MKAKFRLMQKTAPDDARLPCVLYFELRQAADGIGAGARLALTLPQKRAAKYQLGNDYAITVEL